LDEENNDGVAMTRLDKVNILLVDDNGVDLIVLERSKQVLTQLAYCTLWHGKGLMGVACPGGRRI